MNLLLITILSITAAADSLGGSASEALFSRRKPFTSVEAGWRGRSEAAPLFPEEGRAAGKGLVDIRTLVRPDSTRAVAGRVEYANGFKHGVQWNSSSDYSVVYPYVMADTLSGNVRKESYAFSGGYSFMRGEWNFGLRGSYRALHEWREVDPRPRNIVSDLRADFSVGRRISPYYTLDANVYYRRYAQSNSVAYFNPRGANTAQFHLTGLGSYFYRFSGTISSYLSTRYSGNGGGIAINLFPLRGKGWKACAEYGFLDNVHHFPGLNEAPYTELVTHDAAITGSFFGRKWSAGGSLRAQLRNGYEHVLDNGIAGAYNSLMMLNMYSGVFYEAALHGGLSAGRWHFGGEASYRGAFEQYTYPGRMFSVSGVRAAAGAAYALKAGAWTLEAHAKASGFIPTSASAVIPAKYTLEAFQEHQKYRLERLSAAFAGIDAGIMAERPLWKSVYGFTRAGFYYDTLNSVIYSITIGIKL